MVTRKRLLLAGLFAATGIAPSAARAEREREPIATLTPEQEEGPFSIGDERMRRDITEGRPGIPLLFAVRLVDARRGEPLANAAVDIWQCDALGVYSGFGPLRGGPRPGMPPGGRSPGAAFAGGPPPGAPRFGGPPPGGAAFSGPPHMRPQNHRTFLRGVQRTSDAGAVQFATVFPGFYAGRVNHIHMKIHVPDAAGTRASATSRVVHTGQAFFPEAIARALSARNPYAQHHIRRTTLAEDGVFMGQQGSASMVHFRRDAGRSSEGYVASLTLAVRTDV